MAPYFLQQRDTLRRHVQKQEAKNKELADAVLAGRRQVEELQQQVQARQQAWQASVCSCLLSLWSLIGHQGSCRE
jgi:polyamine-modulated factor 1